MPTQKSKRGKKLIFRWWYRTKKGKIVYAHHRPFPMWVDA